MQLFLYKNRYGTTWSFTWRCTEKKLRLQNHRVEFRDEFRVTRLSSLWNDSGLGLGLGTGLGLWSGLGLHLIELIYQFEIQRNYAHPLTPKYRGVPNQGSKTDTDFSRRWPSTLPSPQNLIISQLAGTDRCCRTVDRVGPNGPKSVIEQGRCRSLNDWMLLLHSRRVVLRTSRSMTVPFEFNVWIHINILVALNSWT